jgi:hypothetical protein
MDGYTMWSPMLEPPKTQFVRDRIAEVGDEGRGYIYDLLRLERLATDPSWGLGGGYQFGTLQRVYPVEQEAIWAELREGRYMDPDTFRRRQAELRNRPDPAAEEAAKEAALEQEFWDRITKGL